MSEKKRILVFASGDASGGGSGFQEMVEQSRTVPPILDAEIVEVVSNHQSGGVWEKAQKLNIPFTHWSGPFDAQGYRQLVSATNADYVICSGWLKLVAGLDPAKTVNIHPGPLPRFGGKGMFGHYVHEAVMEAFHNPDNALSQSALTMHFVDEEYDHGAIFFQLPVYIRSDDTPDTLAKRVNEKERAWQSYILSLVVNRSIYLKKGVVYYKSDALPFRY